MYVIWGSTYLAIREAIRTIPPFVSASVRFLLAGGLLYLWAVRRGDRTGDRPVARHWASATIVGGCLLLDRRPRAPTGHLDDTPPVFTVLGVAAVVAWDIADYVMLGRIAREPPPPSRSAQIPMVVPTSGGALLGMAGRF